MRVLALVVALTVASCGSEESSIDSVDQTPESRPEVTDLDVQGHRGARGLRPENTLPSFELALDLGVTTLELDLHYSADGRVIVWHDPVIDPDKCGLSPTAAVGVPDPEASDDVDLAVRNLTAGQLADYACDRNPDQGRFPEQRPDPGDLAGDDYRIVTLGELFAFVADYAASGLKTEAQRTNAANVTFNIETKRDPADPDAIGDGFDGQQAGPFELAVLGVVAAAGLEHRVIVQSFDHRSLRAIAATESLVRLAPLTRDRVRDPGQYAEWGAFIWSPRATTLSADAVELAHGAGLLVVPWTVNDLLEMEELISMGVDGIITDRPDLLLGP